MNNEDFKKMELKYKECKDIAFDIDYHENLLTDLRGSDKVVCLADGASWSLNDGIKQVLLVAVESYVWGLKKRYREL